MKLVIAFIQPEKLNDVKKELYANEIHKMSVTNVLGCGEERGYHLEYRGVDEEVTLLKKMRLEIAVNEEYVEKTISAIINGARTGNIGDGKIFIISMADVIRIRTGERGNSAIG